MEGISTHVLLERQLTRMTSSGDGALTQTTPEPLRGLSDQDVRERRARGEGNSAPAPTSRSYRQIFIENVFTFINFCLFGLGVTLALLGRIGDALTSTAVISLNIVVSVVQEIRAKRTLDSIALLARPTAIVLRDGHERAVMPDELVVGDVIKVGPGDQILVDGRLLADGRLTIDESLLTGEADLVTKAAGDAVFSGTYCVTGNSYYVAERVGAKSLAHQMTASARAFRRVLTPLQREINLVVRIALLIVVYMEFLLVVTSVLHQINLADSVENSAIVAGLVPNGLFLSIAVAYALGAVRILRFGALVQQSNAIESLSHVDVLCLDKTGTLTANRLRVDSVYPLSASQTATEAEFGRVLGAIAASASGGNKTTEAILAQWPSPAYPLSGEVPFSSARKWSAVAFGDKDGNERSMPNLHGIYALGAPEMLRPYLRSSGEGSATTERRSIDDQVRALAAQGLRVLLLACASGGGRLDDRGDASELPPAMEPLGLVALGDELRPEAREALSAFMQAGVQPKIISGDNPDTVAALARQAGLEGTFEVVSGPELDHMSDAEFAAAAESATIFGRISPQQKERLVRALRQHGHYVAMIGDGVNDVLSLKQADLGIAMRSGSQAACGVADVVLMEDSFEVLVPAVAEGQRILNGMQDILKLFLTRISTVGLVILSSLVVGTFPLELRQGSLVTFFSVGVPSIALAVWAHPGPLPQGTLVRRLLHFIVPPMLLTSTIGLLLFVGTYALALLEAGTFGARNPALLPEDFPVAQSTLTGFLVLCGLLLVIFVEPPTPWWVGGNRLSGDRRPTLLALAMMAAFALMTMIPPLRTWFVLSPLGPKEYVLLALALTIWLFTVRLTWRSRLLSRYLSVDLDEPAAR
jgi:cation-transporting ATPase E